jgi:activator of 2-hydroxyglutaryl-CoA dehydratase
MNDKGAAGTGRFFEVISGGLGARLEDFGRIILDSPKGCKGKQYLYCLY